MNSGSQYWYLKDHRIFKNLSPDDLKQICFMAKFKTAKKGEIIFFSNESENMVFTLKKGTIKIVEIDNNGDEIVKDFLNEGDLFGQIYLENESKANEYAVVLSDQAVFCSFITYEFQNLLEQKPSLAIHYTKWIGFWFKRLENKYSNLMFKDVKTRLLYFFKDIVDQSESTDPWILVPNYLTHQDMASLICCTRQTMTSLLNTFKTESIIDYNRKEIKINRKRLLDDI
ncbi:MAG: Crp/Fnr family transcriptional regulator [Leadbetterella sp.]